jgi:hypothetical protein
MCPRRLGSIATALIWAALAAGGAARAADPTVGECLAASESSLTLRRAHKLHDALDQLLICSAASCPRDVHAECIRRVSAVNAAIPTVVFEAKDGDGNDISAVKVSMDGVALTDRLDGAALPLDPGEHTFTFKARGQPAVVKTFVIREGEKDRRERVVFHSLVPVRPPPAAVASAGAATGATTQPAAGPPAAGTVLQTTPPAEPARRDRGTQGTLAIAAMGVGVIGLGVGIGYGLESLSKHHQAAQVCPDVCADQGGVDLWNSAVSAGNVATVGFIVGAAGLAGGAVLWFTAAPAAHDAGGTQVGLGPGTVQLKGAW